MENNTLLEVRNKDVNFFDSFEYKEFVKKIVEINWRLSYPIRIVPIVQTPWGEYRVFNDNFFIPPNREGLIKHLELEETYKTLMSRNPFENLSIEQFAKNLIALHEQEGKESKYKTADQLEDSETPGIGNTTFNILLDKDFGPSDVLPSPFKLIDEEVLKNFSFADTDKESELIEIHAMIPEGSLIVPPHLIKEWARIVINKVLE
jgi:hypothetical protein